MIHFIITGGTIDSQFSTTADQVVVSDRSYIQNYLDNYVHPKVPISFQTLTLRDSRDINDATREDIIISIKKTASDMIIITHGTYTMAETAAYIQQVHHEFPTKKIICTGSMLPLHGFAPTDAPFNLGFAIGAIGLCQPGVYVAMNSFLFPADEVEKRVDLGRFMKKQK